jgi:hypothetical protein
MNEETNQETANVSALMDSVYAINQTLGNDDMGSNMKRTILKANADHIDLQLGKEIYQEALTPEQVSELESAAQAANEAIAILPVEE